ncbi:MAG: hypothetical protein H0W86_01550 [Armatimonadetes bacterium]|nr:hypothetical protein [Armatimonadota bacterium]
MILCRVNAADAAERARRAGRSPNGARLTRVLIAIDLIAEKLGIDLPEDGEKEELKSDTIPQAMLEGIERKQEEQDKSGQEGGDMAKSAGHLAIPPRLLADTPPIRRSPASPGAGPREATIDGPVTRWRLQVQVHLLVRKVAALEKPLLIASGAPSVTKMGTKLAVLLSGFSIAACALGQGMLEPVWTTGFGQMTEALISSDNAFVVFGGYESSKSGEIRDFATGALLGTNVAQDDLSLSADGNYFSSIDTIYAVPDGQLVWTGRGYYGASAIFFNLRLSPTGEYAHAIVRSTDPANPSSVIVKVTVATSEVEWLLFLGRLGA